MEMTGGQALARQLVAEGVTDLFGIPGVQLDWATDALLDVADHLRYVTPRHEQAASYMADGYARAGGREGVCMVVPGPGLLNAMAGMATAYACNARVLCITGQIPSHHIGGGLGMLHEVRGQSAILGSVTRWQGLAQRPQDIPGLVHEAFRQLRGAAQPGPVGLEVPPDVLAARAEVELLPAAQAEDGPALDEAALDALVARLTSARFPVIVAGGGVVAARAGEALRAVAEALQAPVVMTDNGKGALSSRHPLAASALGGRCLLPHADEVLVLGSRFVDGLGRPVLASPGCRFTYVNRDAAHTGAPRQPGTACVADVGAWLRALAARLAGHRPAVSREPEVAQVGAWCAVQIDRIQPQRAYLDALRQALPDDGILVSELTQVGYLAGVAYPVYAPGTFITPGYQGTLGFGFPTALGAALARPDVPVVSISGDGGIGWNLQEFATLARLRPRLTVVLFVDGAFGNVRRIQSNVFQREIGTELHNPDFRALAAAFGLPSVGVDSPEGLASELRAAVAAGGPSVIVVSVGAMPGAWHLIHTFSKVPYPPPPNPLLTPAP